MAYSDLTPVLQNLLEIEYNLQVKMIILFGWWVLSLFYVFFWYKKQEPTKYFILGTFRAVTYSVCYLWIWLFWFLTPVYIHPAQGVDELLIFVATIYSVLFFIFTTILIFNFTVWIPKFIIKKGRLDIKHWEDTAFKNYFGNFKSKK